MDWREWSERDRKINFNWDTFFDLDLINIFCFASHPFFSFQTYFKGKNKMFDSNLNQNLSSLLFSSILLSPNIPLWTALPLSPFLSFSVFFFALILIMQISIQMGICQDMNLDIFIMKILALSVRLHWWEFLPERKRGCKNSSAACLRLVRM